jgi:hypothetical protein
MVHILALPGVTRDAAEAPLALFFGRLQRRLWTEALGMALRWPRAERALVAWLGGPRWALCRWRVTASLQRALTDPLRTILVGHAEGARIVYEVAGRQPVGLLVTMGTGPAGLGPARPGRPASPWLHLGRPGDPWAAPVPGARMTWLPDRGLRGLAAHGGAAYWTEDAADAIARAWHRRHDGDAG